MLVNLMLYGPASASANVYLIRKDYNTRRAIYAYQLGPFLEAQVRIKSAKPVVYQVHAYHVDTTCPDFTMAILV